MNIDDCFHKDVCQQKKENCSENCSRYIQFSNQLELSNLPTAFKKPFQLFIVEEDIEAWKQLDSYQGKNIIDFVNKGQNLYICSNICGNAKTSWACKLLLRYLDQTWKGSFDFPRGVFVSVPKFFNDIKKFYDAPAYLDRIKEADLVVWDDIAFNKLSDYEHNQLFNYIDDRLLNNKSNIYTSNITDIDQLRNIIGSRLASRVYNSSTIVTFNAKDFRVGGKKV